MFAVRYNLCHALFIEAHGKDLSLPCVYRKRTHGKDSLPCVLFRGAWQRHFLCRAFSSGARQTFFSTYR
jgi:hypothetical protein